AGDLVRVAGGTDILRVPAALLAGTVAVVALRPGQGVAVVRALGGPGRGGAPGPFQAHRGEQRAGEPAAEPPQRLPPRHAPRQVFGPFIELELMVHGPFLSLTSPPPARSSGAPRSRGGRGSAPPPPPRRWPALPPRRSGRRPAWRNSHSRG